MNDLIYDLDKKIRSNSNFKIIKNYLPEFDSESFTYANIRLLEKFLIDSHESDKDIPMDLKENVELYISSRLVDRYQGFLIDISDIAPEVDSMIGIAYKELEHIDIFNHLVKMPFVLRGGAYWVSLFESNEKIIESQEK